MRPLLAVLALLPSLTLHAEQKASSAPPELPVAVASFGAAAVPGGDVFIYGGHAGVRHKYNKEDVNGTLHRWQVGSTTWEKLSADEPAQGASLVTTDKGVIRVGGMAARNEKGAKQDLWSSETAALFETASGTWKPLPKLPERRSSHDSAIIGNTLYVIGGWSLTGSSDVKWHDTYLTLDLSKPDAQWVSHPQPFQRRALAAQPVGTKLYAIGGMNSDEEITSEVSILDTETGKWSEGPELPKGRLGGFGFASVAHEGRVFSSGAAGILLELRKEAWVPVAKLAAPRFFHRFVPGGKGQLIAIGGESRNGKKTVPEVITVPAADSTPLSDTDLPKAAEGGPPHGGRPGAPPTGKGGTSPDGKGGEQPKSTPAAAPAEKEKAPEKKAASAPISWPSTPGSATSDWPRYQGPRGDCTTPEVGWQRDWPADGPKTLWKAEAGKGLASFAVVGKRAYTAGNDGKDQDTLWCYDLDTGKVIWKHAFSVPTRCHEMPIVPYGPAATPTVMVGMAWFISRDGDVLCLDAETGSVLWQKHMVDDLGGKRPVYGYSGSPYVHGGRLYLDVGGASGKSNTCLDATSGKVIWQTGDGEAGYATPNITEQAGENVLVSFKGEALELRAPADGKLLARTPMQTRDFCNCATPVIWGDTIFIANTGSEGARTLQWDGQALTPRWSQRGLGLLFHSGVPVQGHLLAFNDGLRGANELRLLSLDNGENAWLDTGIDKGTALVTDDGHVLMLTSKGELVLAKILADKLDVLHRVQVLPAKSWVQPVLAHRRLLCKNNEGAVVCLDLQ